MSRSETDLLVNPVFDEVLSGEITPPSYIEDRIHTLGNLVIATFINGEQSSNDHRPQSTYNYKKITYRLSWAPNVISEIGGFNLKNSNQLKLESLSLRNRTNHTGLHILTDSYSRNKYRKSYDSYKPSILLDTGKGRPTWLHLGDQLDIAKHKITSLAQLVLELDAIQ